MFGRLAITVEALAPTTSTALYVTAFHVKLTFDDTTIMAWTLIGAPVFGFLPVPNTRHFQSSDGAGGDCLGFANSLRPLFEHGNAAKNDHLLGARHGVSWGK
jgi:hypothetical protein